MQTEEQKRGRPENEAILLINMMLSGLDLTGYIQNVEVGRDPSASLIEFVCPS